MVKNNDSLEYMLEGSSRYCYEGSNILINKANIQNESELERVERLQTTYILSKLYLEPIKGNFDIEHLKNIHKVLFQDLYEFAGTFRTENISKGGTPFCPTRYIHSYLNDLLKKMKNQSYQIHSEEELIEFLAYFYSEINLVHPFRDGNGRTIREFFREYVLELNKKINFGHYELQFARLSETDYKIHLLGCIESAKTGNLEHLKQFFGSCLVKQKQKEL